MIVPNQCNKYQRYLFFIIFFLNHEIDAHSKVIFTEKISKTLYLNIFLFFCNMFLLFANMFCYLQTCFCCLHTCFLFLQTCFLLFTNTFIVVCNMFFVCKHVLLFATCFLFANMFCCFANMFFVVCKHFSCTDETKESNILKHVLCIYLKQGHTFIYCIGAQTPKSIQFPYALINIIHFSAFAIFNLNVLSYQSCYNLIKHKMKKWDFFRNLPS